MATELQLWQFIAERIRQNQEIILLVVLESSGSSPGRAGYKMAVAADGELAGSIGGGVMEVNLVEQSRAALSEPPALAYGLTSKLIEQVHRKNAPNASGMICSGKQAVVVLKLTERYLQTVDLIIDAIEKKRSALLTISPDDLTVRATKARTRNKIFDKRSEIDFIYTEKLGPTNELFIVGGGHCALALSELVSKLDFRISIFDDRPELNTLAKNQYADQITIIESYDEIAEHIPSGANIYVVVMTLGFKSDEIVIRSLFDKNVRYFGVLGSKAKMKTLFTTLEKDGFSKEGLAKIHTPIGVPINSRTPEEIAISIAAEIIALKNDATLSRSLKEHQNR